MGERVAHRKNLEGSEPGGQWGSRDSGNALGMLWLLVPATLGS